MSYHLDRHRQKRELVHQAEIAARQEMRLRFFRKREAAAWRQAEAFVVRTRLEGGRVHYLAAGPRWLRYRYGCADAAEALQEAGHHMITPEHIPSFNRLAPYMKPDMLMLGRQTNTARYAFPCEYKTLDLDGGDFEIDLGAKLPLHEDARNELAWQTVFNLGTIEHVWDAHQAWVNAASMVAIGGHFLGQSPVAGWEGHAIHITDWTMINKFFMENGFAIYEGWWTTQAGNECDQPKRNGGKSVLYWFVMKRLREDLGGIWQKPSQVYKKGVKPT